MNKLDELADRIRGAAVEYRALTGRPLGVTGEIGEIEVARLLGYGTVSTIKKGVVSNALV